MSDTELKLWQELRRKPIGFRFRRQHPIDHYILDFYCHSARLCVEVDDDSHCGREAYDSHRDVVLEKLGIGTIRVDWPEIRDNLGGVVEHVLRACCTRTGREYDDYRAVIRKPSP